MGRKPQEVNPESGKRLKLWLDRMGISAKALCDAINYTPQYISDVITGKKRLTPDLAKAIANVSGTFRNNKTGEDFSLDDYDKARQEYLLLKDQFMTENDRFDSYEDNRSSRTDLLIQLLESHFYKIKDSTDDMPYRRDPIDGTLYQDVTFSITSPCGSMRFFSHEELLKFLQSLDDCIEMHTAFQFRRLIDGVRNRYKWEV